MRRSDRALLRHPAFHPRVLHPGPPESAEERRRAYERERREPTPSIPNELQMAAEAEAMGVPIRETRDERGDLVCVAAPETMLYMRGGGYMSVPPWLIDKMLRKGWARADDLSPEELANCLKKGEKLLDSF